LLGNDIWGWTDPDTGREFAIMGLSNKTSFVDVTDPASPRHLVDIPTSTHAIIWRDIKVYRGHAFIVSEAMGHGLQVYDLSSLKNAMALKAEALPLVAMPDARYTLFGSSHNIVINEESGFAYAVGSDTCDAGIHVIDIREPKHPRFSTCIDRAIFDPPLVAVPEGMQGFSGDTYTHDAQCVIYKGPDFRYRGREICVASNSDSVNLVDVTDKANPKQISAVTYPQLGFVHQGWLTENQQYYLQGDELDENKSKTSTRTHMVDFSDLEQPRYMGFHEYAVPAVDHNIYVKGDLAFAANYSSGLRILDISKIAEAKLSEIAFFDTMPEKQGEDDRNMYGAWSVYPYFASGTIAVSNMDGKLFLLKLNE
jgi:choice-of-anchor B domain-containing protein